MGPWLPAAWSALAACVLVVVMVWALLGVRSAPVTAVTPEAFGAGGTGGGDAPVAGAAPAPPGPVEAPTVTAAPLPTTLPTPKLGFTEGQPRPASPAPVAGEVAIGGGGGEGGSGSGGAAVGARGDISFTLQWTFTPSAQPARGGILPGGPDVDMWVTDPGGERLSTSRDGRGLGPTASGGRIDLDDQGAFDARSDGGGPERAYWPQGLAPRGTYQYGVTWFQGVGTASYIFRVYRGQTEVRVHRGVLRDTQRGEPVTLGSIDN